MLTQQVVKVLTDIEIHGHCTIPVKETAKSTIDAIHQLCHTHGVWQPGASVSYVFAKLAPNNTADKKCTVEGLSQHNKVHPPL